MADDKIPLYLINGPLGSGKTSLLEYVLTLPEFANARVIENEYANENIDGERLAGRASSVATITGNCVCCSTGDELVKTLYDFSRDSAAPVLIEATGVARSMQVVEKLVAGDVFERYTLAQAWMVVDAPELLRDGVGRYEVEMQAADVVLLSKLDLLSSDERARCDALLAQLSLSRVMTIDRGVFDYYACDTESTMLEFFDTFDGEYTLVDNPTYSVIDTHGLAIDAAQLEAVWPMLVADYGLRRMKGAVRLDDHQAWHMEATPSQVASERIFASGVMKLVFIGEKAEQLTREVLIQALAN